LYALLSTLPLVALITFNPLYAFVAFDPLDTLLTTITLVASGDSEV
jgi:hypothetical protein